MSRIGDLIHECCPSGVPFKRVSDVAKYVRGVTYSKDDEQVDGPLHVLRSNNITLASNTLNFDDVKNVSEKVRVRSDQRLYAGDIIVSAASGSKTHIGKVAYIEDDIDYVFGGFMAVLRSKGDIASRFLFHLLASQGFSEYLGVALNSTTINNLNASITGAFRVPVPPIQVQREIVRVLDLFQSLEAELEAELEARRRQYAYYRDLLFTFPESGTFPSGALRGTALVNRIANLIKRLCPGGVPSQMLGDLGAFVRGNGMQKGDLVASGAPAIHYGQIHTYYGTAATETLSFVAPAFAEKLRKAEPGDLVIATTSEDDEAVGKAVAWLGDTAAAVSGDAYVYRHSLVPQYVSYFFQSGQFQDQKRPRITGTKVRRISGEGLATIKIPVPPAEVQHEIASILDKFDTLTGSLSVGLPAELAARRKQYEYYRDRLLTFTELAK